MTGLARLVLLTLGLVPLVFGNDCLDLPPLEIRGKHFYNSATKAYVPIKGLAYYPRPNAGPLDINTVDLFTEEYRSFWERDIEQFKALNINALRIYAVDPSKNHDGFMCALKSVGIYVLVGLAAGCKNCAVANFPAPDCYPAALKTRGQFIISTFSVYDNVIGFSAGNEVDLRSGNFTDLGACQKRFARDMREYIASCPLMRKIPVGFAIGDRNQKWKAQYYGCRTVAGDEFEVVDWLGINTYRHCDGAETDPLNLPGYQLLLEDYQELQLSFPVIITEFGCKSPTFPTIDGYEGQRDFLEVDTIFSEEYLLEFSGGFAYEYSTERGNARGTSYPFTNFSLSNFGVGYFSPEDCDGINITCEYVRTPEFDLLAERYASVSNAQPPIELWERPEVAECPPEFVSLDSFDWPADSEADWSCPTAAPTPSPTVLTAPPTNSAGVPNVPSSNGLNGGASAGLTLNGAVPSLLSMFCLLM